MSEHSGLLSETDNDLTDASEKETDEKEKNTFSSGIGLVLSCLGAVVGTGNIWRYPRIVAIHAGGGGALVFLIVWFCFLWLWSIPIILIEYGAGRFTRLCTVEGANKLAGAPFRFLGAWIAVVNNVIGCYYSVLVGWCMYYFGYHIFHELPANLDESYVTWNSMHDNYWPVLCHFLSVVIASLSVSRGVSTIEPMNKVVVPMLLLIVLFSFYWAIFLPYAHIGIEHFFTPNWSSLGDSRMWLDAITQNAWDTGAALGAFWTYAIFMNRKNGVVKIGILTPLTNNCVSLLCGLLVFSCVFSVLIRLGYVSEGILEIIGDNGPANTGLTFLWMPLLYNNISGGRFLCALFFLCLCLAGISSLISILELGVHVLNDFGIRRIPATIIIGTLNFSFGLASALSVDFLVNQDTVWGYALLISGLFFVVFMYRYGAEKFRRVAVNEYGIGDWKLPRLWTVVIYVLTPLQAVAILIWYFVTEITDNKEERWYKYSRGSLIMVLTQWVFVLLVLFGLNWWMKPLHINSNNPVLRLIFRSGAFDSQPAVMDDHGTPSDDEREATSEYYQLTASGEVIDLSNSGKKNKTRSESEEEIEL